MKGHIRERSPGRWAIVIDLHDPETGKRRRKWHSFHGTKREAQVECSRLIWELKGGTYVEPSNTTVRQFLDRWLDHTKSQVAPRTHERYTEIALRGLAPLLGDVLLPKLKAISISGAYSKALAEGRRDGRGGLSPRTVLHMHRVLRQALQQAVDWDMLARNPTDKVAPPKIEKAEMRALDADETAALLEAVHPTRLFMPVLLAVTCGMRRGEITALRWRSVDLVNGVLEVKTSAEQTKAGVREKDTKTGRARSVTLTTLAAQELRRHKVRQAEELLRLGVRQADDVHVIAQVDGQPLKPNSLTHEFVRFIAKTKLPRIRFHDLRHTHATQLLKSNVHPKIVQERLGHEDITTTLNLYSHVLPGMQDEAARRVDEALRNALEKHRKAKG
ncbi:MAG: site-specific integrase [Acidobacteria bacterium]|nr:MAG: site-specific integrase [Acidobacteriota bacterium]